MGQQDHKFLSDFLPFKPVAIGQGSDKIRIFVKPSLPFPIFSIPALELKIDHSFILK